MPPGSRLDGFWDDWLQDVGSLLGEEERLYFEILEDDAARERFAAGFWESRGVEALERWRRNREDARRLRSASPARERAVLLVGKPGSIETFPRCGALRRLEVWTWEPPQLIYQGLSGAATQWLLFVEGTTLARGSFEPWTPGDIEGLTRGLASYSTAEGLIEALNDAQCIEAGALARLGEALAGASSAQELTERVPWPRPDTAWLELLADSERPFDGRLELSFPGSFTRYTILRGALDLPIARLAQIRAGEVFDRITVVGDLFQGSRLVDSFEIVHHIAGTAPSDRVELEFFRRLPPGGYRLHLRVADRYGLGLVAVDRQIEVPLMTEEAPEPAGYAEGYAWLTRNELVQLNTLPSVELLPPLSDAAGRREARAITHGGPIAEVEFRFAGERLAVDAEPPYTVRVPDLEEDATLLAVALDPDGRSLAEDRRVVSPPDRPFQVRFGEILAAAQGVAVDISLPIGERVTRLECRAARRTLHESTGPPYVCPLPEPSTADYLTARVTLSGGDAQEDVLFLGPRVPERVDVQLAELYLTVFDGGGRPALGIAQEDVRVWSDGGSRPVVRVESLQNLPLSVAVLMDISSSMGRSLQTAAASARDFFERVLTEGDRASLLAFNHDLHALVPFTSDFEALRFGAVGLRAWGATRLHDAMVHALFQFAGRSNRRALIVLSDGSDVGSDFPLEQVLGLAVRAGVAVYPVSLGRVGSSGADGLERLAEASGGRSFRVGSARDLPRAYRQIEQELRAQYLVVYEPDVEDPLTPQVEVEILRQGYGAREVRRHSP